MGQVEGELLVGEGKDLRRPHPPEIDFEEKFAMKLSTPPQGLTWNLKMSPWKRENISKKNTSFGGSMLNFRGVASILLRRLSHSMLISCEVDIPATYQKTMEIQI